MNATKQCRKFNQLPETRVRKQTKKKTHCIWQNIADRIAIGVSTC